MWVIWVTRSDQNGEYGGYQGRVAVNRKLAPMGWTRIGFLGF